MISDDSFEKCVICQENVFLPVIINCFPCYSKNEIHCYSMNRQCFRCVCDYLQVFRENRELFRKCLFCPNTLFLDETNLHYNDIFSFDFYLMKQDRNNSYFCPLCKEACKEESCKEESCKEESCKEECQQQDTRMNQIRKGTQIEIYRHMEIDCPFFPLFCLCKKYFFRHEIDSHKKKCIHFFYCFYCHVFLPSHEKKIHLIHSHSFMECPQCLELFPKDQIDSHLREKCPHRLVSCNLCFQSVSYSKIHIHLIKHGEDLHRELILNQEKHQQLLRSFSIYMSFCSQFLGTVPSFPSTGYVFSPSNLESQLTRDYDFQDNSNNNMATTSINQNNNLNQEWNSIGNEQQEWNNNPDNDNNMAISINQNNNFNFNEEWNNNTNENEAIQNDTTERFVLSRDNIFDSNPNHNEEELFQINIDPFF